MKQFAVWKPFLEEAKLYLAGLTNDKGIPMYQTKRRTPFLGLICSVAIFNELVGNPNSPLKYLLTYKLSQGHLELFLVQLDLLAAPIIILQFANLLQHTRDY